MGFDILTLFTNQFCFKTLSVCDLDMVATMENDDDEESMYDLYMDETFKIVLFILYTKYDLPLSSFMEFIVSLCKSKV